VQSGDHISSSPMRIVLLSISSDLERFVDFMRANALAQKEFHGSSKN